MIDLDPESLDRILPATAGARDWDDVVDRFRGHQRRRRRRVVVVCAVAAVAALSASAFGIRAFILDRGFVGLPPEGATPSAPETGKLVLSFAGRSTSTVDDTLVQTWVFADGRLIWARPGSRPEGANDFTTGLLEQHLSPAGVEQLRSEVVSTGLFDHDLTLSTTRFLWGRIAARIDDRLVTVDWANSNPYSDGPDAAARTPAAAEQYRGLERLDALLAYPGPRLRASVWEDKAIRAYVPSSFAVCYSGTSEEPSDPQSDPSRILSLLPQGAQEILAGKDRTRQKSYRGWSGGPYYPVYADCVNVTTDEARELAAVLDSAGLEQFEPAGGLAYTFEVPGSAHERGAVFVEPLLPDGSWTTFRAG